MEQDNTYRLVIVTGMSGGGKTQACRHLEDLGFFCVDNLPPVFIPKFAELCAHSAGHIARVVLVVDTRSREFFDTFLHVLEDMDKAGQKYELLFMDATDEAIIELSDAPYYTACPNPFIKDFIEEYGTPYDEETDDYHREPFTADVSEGKNDPIYNAHTYHTKVPYKAIMRYILHYTEPGDVVLDGFCGTGMTGAAASACENPQLDFRALVNQTMKGVHWGKRHAILSDLSPAASYITYNYNHRTDVDAFDKAAHRILHQLDEEYGWMFKTNIPTRDDQLHLDRQPQKREMSFMAWSDMLICPHCGEEYVFYDAAFDSKTGKVAKTFSCPICSASLQKKDCQQRQQTLDRPQPLPTNGKGY